MSTKQVQVQVWISETSDTGLRDLGANLDYTRFVNGIEQKGHLERVTTNLFNPQNSNYTVTVPSAETQAPFDNLRPDESGTPADNIQTQEGAGLTATIISRGAGTINTVFRSLERKSDLDLVSKPEILVRDGQVAEVAAGGQVPYQSIAYDAAFRPNLKVVWQNVGVTLRIKPKILSDDMVQIDLIRLDITDLTQIDKINGLDLPVFSTRSQTGLTVVPNGQTLVIGGLASSETTRTEQRVPILGKLPILGIPFRWRDVQTQKNNMLVFLSPTIVDLRALKPQTNDALMFWRRDNREKWNSEKRIEKEIESLQAGTG